ncbi:hypothetical protein BJV82DRAFT_663089 [Fennellomyces sp. T-0311]|nr:hypothetical protein BJV82DRAFT_663089 [Fennellomyces sp. T-0311]
MTSNGMHSKLKAQMALGSLWGAEISWEDIKNPDTAFWNRQATMDSHELDVLRNMMSKMRATEELALLELRHYAREKCAKLEARILDQTCSGPRAVLIDALHNADILYFKVHGFDRPHLPAIDHLLEGQDTCTEVIEAKGAEMAVMPVVDFDDEIHHDDIYDEPQESQDHIGNLYEAVEKAENAEIISALMEGDLCK